jgi:transposase-like protein
VTHAADVCVVQGRIDLVEYEEGRRLEAVDREEKRKSRHGALAAAELVHVAEALERRHCVVLDALKVRLLCGVIRDESRNKCSKASLNKES